MESASPSEILNDGFRSARRYAGLLGLYLGLTVPFDALYAFAMNRAYVANTDGTEGMRLAEWGHHLHAVASFALPVIGAAAAAIVFSRMARELDKPLFKVRDDKEALRRFFVPWFILFLFLSMIWNLFDKALQYTDSPEALLLPGLFICSFVTAFAIPFGACVMFHGKLDWSLIGEALAPLGNKLPHTALLVGFGFMAAVTLNIAVGSVPVGYWPIQVGISALDGYLDIVVFAASIELCRQDRDIIDTDDDDDGF